MVHYPSPQEVGIRVPPHLKQPDFAAGFDWALRGGQITRIEQLRQSYREGFRAGKLYLNELRRVHKVIPFPLRARVRLSSICSY